MTTLPLPKGNPPKYNYTGFTEVEKDRIRYRIATCTVGPIMSLRYHFEIYNRPYFFGLIGRKRWIKVLEEREYLKGFAFCKCLMD